MSSKSLVIVLLTLFSSYQDVVGQQLYNACNQALELCPGEVVSADNFDANITFCPDCEDDFTSCFTPANSVWFTFTTNSSGGDVNVNFSNLVFSSVAGSGTELQATILQATVPCNSASYSFIGNCISSGSGPFILTGSSLPANTVYYVVVSGSSIGPGVTSPAECSFDIAVSGPGIDRALSSITLSSASTTYCANQTITVSATMTDCPDNDEFTWYINGVLSAVTSDPFFLSSNLSSGDVISVQTNCYQLCPITVSDNLDPLNITSLVVDAGPDITIDQGDTVQLTGFVSSGVFMWSPSFALSAADALNPFVWPAVTTTYTLTVSEGACTQSDDVTVFVEPELFFPNTFSPNDDGTNDTWQIKGIELYPNSFVRIFDRWGQEIFQSTGYSAQKAWDGTVSSGKVAEGVYYYVVELRDAEKQVFNGSISVIR